MKRLFLTVSIVFVLCSFAQAAVTSLQFTAACMKLDNGTKPKCTCMAEKFGQELSETEKTYAHALLTSDEIQLAPINGNLEDKKAKAVKAKMIPLMMDCLL